MFGTALNYVALRLLGVPKHHPVATRARNTLHKLGMGHDARFVRAQLILYPRQVARPESLRGGSSGSQCSMYTNGMETIRYQQNYGQFVPFLRFKLRLNVVHGRLLPDWVPIHPHRWWIHVRNVYVPMSYLYGIRFQHPENALILSLRQVSLSNTDVFNSITEANILGTLY